MKYVHGVVAKCLYSADKKHRLEIIARYDGRFEFRAYQEITKADDLSPGKTLTYWSPQHQSGLFADPDTAERDAEATFAWLRGRVSE